MSNILVMKISNWPDVRDIALQWEATVGANREGHGSLAGRLILGAE